MLGHFSVVFPVLFLVGSQEFLYILGIDLVQNLDLIGIVTWAPHV